MWRGCSQQVKDVDEEVGSSSPSSCSKPGGLQPHSVALKPLGLCPPLCLAPRAPDQEAELLRQHLEPQQHHQPLQHQQWQGGRREEEEEEELGRWRSGGAAWATGGHPTAAQELTSPTCHARVPSDGSPGWCPPRAGSPPASHPLQPCTCLVGSSSRRSSEGLAYLCPPLPYCGEML